MKHDTPLWVGGNNNPEAKVRLFCLPAAGGGSLSFRDWSQHLNASVEVRPVRLPGREMRIAEDRFNEARSAAKALVEGLKSYLDLPFAIFGHSMGALLAFELTRELRRSEMPLPFSLMVSSRRAPKEPLTRELFHTLSDSDLTDVLRNRYAGGTPEVVLKEKELMALFLPIIRDDFALTDTYTYTPEEPLDCPIYAFGGESETELSETSLDAWREETRNNFQLELFPGGHFYLNAPSQSVILKKLDEILKTKYMNC